MHSKEICETFRIKGINNCWRDNKPFSILHQAWCNSILKNVTKLHFFYLCKGKNERWNTKRGNIENPLCVNNNTTFFFFLLGFDLDMQINTSKRGRRWSFTLKNESSNLDMLLVIENCIPLQKIQFSTTLPKLFSNLHSWTRSPQTNTF